MSDEMEAYRQAGDDLEAAQEQYAAAVRQSHRANAMSMRTVRDRTARNAALEAASRAETEAVQALTQARRAFTAIEAELRAQTEAHHRAHPSAPPEEAPW